MRRLAAAAVALAIALPACAQRGGGGHAGFSARSAPAMRSAPAFHGNYGPSASFHYSSGLAHAPMVYAPSRMAAPGARYPGAVPINRPAFYHHGGGITTPHNVIVRGYPYPYYGYGYGYYPGGVYLGGFFDDDDYNPNVQPDYGAQPDYGSPAQPDYSYPAQPDDSYAQPAPDYGYAYPQPAPAPEYGYAYPQPVPAYPAYPQPAPQPGYTVAPAPGYVALGPPASNTPQMQYVPGSSDSTILIYKNGRPPEQIQNYLATRTTLTVLDGGRRRVIPLDDLDIPATVRANRQTGVDFKLPSIPGTTGCTGICASSPE